MRRARLPVDRQIVELAVGFVYQSLKIGRGLEALTTSSGDDAALLNCTEPIGEVT